jgi:hypothetical protein
MPVVVASRIDICAFLIVVLIVRVGRECLVGICLDGLVVRSRFRRYEASGIAIFHEPVYRYGTSYDE